MKYLLLHSIRFSILFSWVFVSSLKAQFNADKIADYTSMVNKWNEAHNNWKFDDLKLLYADKVLFYCSPVTKEQCIKDKMAQVSPSKIFIQKIVSDVTCIDFGKGYIKCEFIKEYIMGEKKFQFPSYLLLQEINGELKIICESDLITDSNMGFKISPDLFQKKEYAEVAQQAVTSNKKPSKWPIYTFSSSLLIILIVAFAARRRRKNRKQI